MSVARVTRVERAMKDQGVCGHAGCEVKLEKGGPYLWFKVGFRSRYKHVRCIDHYPRQSERESSLVASVLAAQEDFADQIDSLEGIDDIRSAVEAVAEAAREVAGEYETASTDQNGTVWNTDAEERYNTLEGAADELESWQPDEDEPSACGEHDEVTDDCNDCASNVEEWLEAVRSSATEAVDGMELP